MKEKWKNIDDYEGFYQVSNIGRVRSFKVSNNPGYIMKTRDNSNGYLLITFRINGVKKAHLLHRLVAEAFIPNPKNKEQVNHLNGIKTDNNVENLEWCSRSENMIHAYKNGLRSMTEETKRKIADANRGKGVLTENDIPLIRELASNGQSHQKISEKYDVTRSTISHVVRGDTWNHV